jgi:hypothetical protein
MYRSVVGVVNTAVLLCVSTTDTLTAPPRAVVSSSCGLALVVVACAVQKLPSATRVQGVQACNLQMSAVLQYTVGIVYIAMRTCCELYCNHSQ